MPEKNRSLHGSAPDKSETALLIIDVINDLDFPEANQLMPDAPAMARKTTKLKERAKKARIPVIYVNDNFGRWRSDLRRLVEHCRQGKAHEIVDLLEPEDDDYFVLKPKHSGFFSSSLQTLLRYLGAKTLILTGIAGNYCVLFTANDAYMRDYKLIVPSDCTVSNTKKENDQALTLMRDYLKADTRSSAKIQLRRRRASENLTIFSASGFCLELVDFFRRFCFRQAFVEFFTSFAAERLQIRTLRTGHWFLAGRPFFRWFLGILRWWRWRRRGLGWIFVFLCHQKKIVPAWERGLVAMLG